MKNISQYTLTSDTVRHPYSSAWKRKYPPFKQTSVHLHSNQIIQNSISELTTLWHYTTVGGVMS